ncbi:hypothetical protein JTE90_012721 [Oedothorax gibbosus]|uniref:Dynein axonemal assembly factor 11-like CS domain-containing protein n=1 Tax=Oedothorax gibbosus TaxID=931172 RepID=A0AAV6VYV6_9ARAC|nr:hypothetical protein JTE90_012721 [Oedothorax gibbosus]
MATITEELLRKCAEHNECEIFSLEEVSLHQRNIKKIENIDRWCRDLKILYLQSNLISKIENLSRLKKLEYINFTLNNITKIENLKGCESLKKLDFTVNFIGELTSVESLQENYNLEELYLTGNPCTEFEGYREYVVATLPQISNLDGDNIKKSERIVAMQKYNRIRGEILDQQRRFLKNINYTSEDVSKILEDSQYREEHIQNQETQDEFWKQKTKHTPFSRIEIYKQLKKAKNNDDKETSPPDPPRKLITDDGKILNVNEAKLEFNFIDDEENNCYQLDLAVFRYLDTSCLEADVQPNYVRIRIKDKYFQLSLPEEVHPDQSTTCRSQTTGHLLVTMPKANQIITDRSRTNKTLKENNVYATSNVKNNEVLEVKPTIMASIDKIVTDEPSQHKNKSTSKAADSREYCPKENLEFVDDPSVPPLI